MPAKKIKEESDVPFLNLALDTISIGKQALVFVNTKKSAEAAAEKIAMQVKTSDKNLEELSEKVLHVLSTPTKQCKRLAFCVKNGTAFHHAGLPSGQRSLIEENFKKGLIRIICATPTLAMGINMPAFRVIMKDLKRFAGRGMDWISTLEYHQMTGRAGRPDFNDKFGEAICIAETEGEREYILDKYLNGLPESIYSKLAVEPVLRTYVLSLVAANFARSKSDLLDFFRDTFYGHQFRDMAELELILSKIIASLEEWGFVKVSGCANDFVCADELSETKVAATPLGERVAQLYLDPYTANYIITALRRGTEKHVTEFSFMSMAATTLELRPAFHVRVKELEDVENYLAENMSLLIVLEPSVFEPEYDEFLDGIKTALVLNEWLEEKDEDFLLDTYNVTPGEFRSKLDIADWILYAAEELSNLLQFRDLLKVIRKTRFRLKHGVKEELVPLVRLKGIGRKRARRLFKNNIKDVGDIKKADLATLIELIGRETAIKLKKEAGAEVPEAIPERRRKGQLGLGKYQDE